MTPSSMRLLLVLEARVGEAVKGPREAIWDNKTRGRGRDGRKRLRVAKAEEKVCQAADADTTHLSFK